MKNKIKTFIFDIKREIVESYLGITNYYLNSSWLIITRDFIILLLVSFYLYNRRVFNAYIICMIMETVFPGFTGIIPVYRYLLLGPGVAEAVDPIDFLYDVLVPLFFCALYVYICAYLEYIFSWLFSLIF